VNELKSYFAEKVGQLNELGVEDIILDPGFGFGKTTECNYEILKQLETIRLGGLPVLAGLSRKSMINRVLNTLPEEALNGSTVLHTIALLNGANILRVHDVKEAVEAVKLLKYLRDFEHCE
jgi:dihydropteroate synthase